MRKLSLLALVLLVSGCGEAPPPPDQTTQTSATAEEGPIVLTAAQQEGRVIYQTVCWTCHGNAGRGDGPAVEAGSVPAPPTFHTQDYATATAAELERRFRIGMDEADETHPHMQYVASLLQPERFQAALAYIPALAYPAELPGSALAGEGIYAFRCAGCHGEGGRGDGPAAEALVTVKPVDFRTDTLVASQDWDGLFQRVREGGQAVHGSSMPPWGVILTDAQMWDLVAYLGTLQEGALDTPPWATGS